MSSVIERLREEGREKGREEGRELSCVDFYVNGFEPDIISKGLKISTEEVYNILKKYNVDIRE